MNGVHVRVLAGGEHYAVPVSAVLEISEYGEVSPVPGAPPSTLGVRNLRGQVIPVIDLAMVLDLRSSTAYERIVVAEDDGRLAGFAVEGVVDVGDVGDPTEETESPYLTGALLIDGALVGVVAVGALFAALAPTDDRAEAVSR